MSIYLFFILCCLSRGLSVPLATEYDAPQIANTQTQAGQHEQYVRSEHHDASVSNDGNESLAYYGGLRGHYLQHSVNPHRIPQSTIKQPPLTAAVGAPDYGKNLPQNMAEQQTNEFNKIQAAASRLVAIQEMAKQKGSFSAEDNRVYAASLLELGQAAQNLAKLQQSGQIKDFSVLLEAANPTTQQPAHSSAEQQPPNDNAANVNDDKVDVVTEQHVAHDDLSPLVISDPYEDINDTVAVTTPKKDAAVAEAKPVGVSIVGVGGVASSKPNAIALSGRNGLAVSSPKATAIAGISPDNVAAYNLVFPTRHPVVIKTPMQPSVLSNTDYYDLIETSPDHYVRHSSRGQGNQGIQSENDVRVSNAASDITAGSSIDAILKMWQESLDAE